MLRSASRIEDLSISVVTHEHFKGSGQELRDWLVRRKNRCLYYVAHQFFYTKDTESYLTVFRRGEKVKESHSPHLPPKEFLLYLRDAFFTIKFLFFTKRHFDIYVGVDSFNAFFGVILKKLGKVDTTVFFTIDYVMHNRFPWPWLNRFYVWLDRFAFFNSDYTWNVSDRMSRQRILELGDPAKDKKQLVVPIGIVQEADGIQVPRKEYVLVYSGGLTPEFGLEMIIQAVPELAKRFPELEVRIIGGGVLEEQLKKEVAGLGVEKHVNFIGFINTTTERERWLTLLKESTVGLATYEDNETSYKRYSDVTKPKDYMSCGLPIIVTPIIPLSEDVEQHNLGRVVKDNTDDFIRGVTELLSDKKEREQIERNVKEFCKDMTWDNIFERVFQEMGITSTL